MLNITLNKSIAFTGMPGTGKTWDVKEALLHTLKTRPDVKIIILIDFDSPYWQYAENKDQVKSLPAEQLTPIPIIEVEDIPYWSSGQFMEGHRIVRTNSHNYYESYRLLQNYCSNLTILIEEFSKCMTNYIPPKTFDGLLQDRKAKNFDIIMAFHFLFEIPREIRSKLDVLVIKKTNENYQDIKSRIYHPHLKEIMELIKASKNPYIGQTLQLRGEE